MGGYTRSCGSFSVSDGTGAWDNGMDFGWTVGIVPIE